MRKLILNLLFVFIVMGFASALTVEDYGTFRTKDCINLIQVCDNCTYNNITSVITPNSTSSITVEKVMTKSGIQYNYTYCDTNQIGKYTVNGKGDNDGILSAWAYTFTVNTLGREYTIAQSITYTLFFIFVFIIFLLTLFFGFKMPNNELRNEDGRIIQLNWNKYAKWGLFAVAYICSFALMYFAWNLSYAFLGFSAMTNFFSVGFKILIMGAIPIFVIGTIIMAANYLTDWKMYDKLMKGLTVR